MKQDVISGQFIGAPGRRVFVLLREPMDGSCEQGSVLVIPPFGEEMNKSRRMLAETSQRLSESGLAVIMPDLFGTGDSEGEFRDAEIATWLENLEATSRHAESRGLPVRAILAVRFGCALAVAGVERGALPAVAASAWWQPVLDGKRHLTQFLRLRVAAVSMRGDDPESVEGLRRRSAAGETLLIAGYELSPALVRGLDGLQVGRLPPQVGDLNWFEFVREGGAGLPLPARRLVDGARASGRAVSVETMVAEPFWTSAEIVRVPQLVERTATILTLSSHGPARRAPTAAPLDA